MDGALPIVRAGAIGLGSSSGRSASFVFWRRKLGQQVRPVASNNAAYFVIEDRNITLA